MATLKYKRAPLINKGDKITSKQYNALAQAFNDRITGGAADVAYRIWWYAHSLVRNIRNPEDEHTWPQSDEWWKLYGMATPGTQNWTDIGGPDEPAGANLSNPLNAFVFGQGDELESEANRVYLSTLGSKTTYLEGNTPVEDLLKIWHIAKLQRGYISPISHQLNAPVYEMTRYTDGLTYSYLSPYLKSYTSYRPTPYSSFGSAETRCPDHFDIPFARYLLRFEPLVENLPVLEFPTCPGEIGHVQHIFRGETGYTLIIATQADTAGNVKASSIVNLPYSQYLETGTTGGGTLYKNKGEQISQLHNNYISDAKGTEQEVINNNYVISKTGFNVEQFLTTQFKLSPAIGMEWMEGYNLKVGHDPLNSYPLFIANDTYDITIYGDAPAPWLRHNNWIYSVNTASDKAAEMENFRTTSRTYDTFVTFSDVGCLGGYLVSWKGLSKSITINIFDFEVDSQGKESAPIGKILASDITLSVNSKVQNIIKYFDAPVHYKRLKVKVLSIGGSPTTTEKVPFSSSSGYVNVELLQQAYYLPTIYDAYGLIRLGSTNGKNGDYDTMLRTDFSGVSCKALYSTYYNRSIISNPASAIGDPGNAPNVNPVYESTRKTIIDNLRMVARQQLTGYRVNAAGNSVLYFRKTLPEPGTVQNSTYGQNLTPVDSTRIAKITDISATTTLTAGGKYLVTFTGNGYWKPIPNVNIAPEQPMAPVLGTVAEPPIAPKECILYANAKYQPEVGYGTPYEITGEANYTFTLNEGDSLAKDSWPNLGGVDPSNPFITVNAIIREYRTGTSGPGQVAVRWFCKSATNVDIPQLVTSGLWDGTMNNPANLKNGYTFEVWRKVKPKNSASTVSTKVASGPGNTDSSITCISSVNSEGALIGGFLFIDSFPVEIPNPTDNTLTYEIVQIPTVVNTAATKLQIVSKYQFLPTKLSITGWAADKRYKIIRTLDKKETVLAVDHKEPLFLDTLSDLDYPTYKSNTNAPVYTVYARTNVKGSAYSAQENAHTILDYTPTAWLAGGQTLITANSLIPRHTFNAYNISKNFRVAIEYQLHGYTSTDQLNDPSATIIYDEYDPTSRAYVSQSATVAGATKIYWGNARANENQETGEYTTKLGIRNGTLNKFVKFAEASKPVNFSIASIKTWDGAVYTEIFKRSIMAGADEAHLNEIAIGSNLPTVAANSNPALKDRGIYAFSTGVERLAFKDGTGIVENKTYLVRSAPGKFANYQGTNYADGQTFVGVLGHADFITTDASVAVFLVESYTADADLALFEGMLGPVVTPTKPIAGEAVACDSFLKISSTGVSDDIVYKVTGTDTPKISYKKGSTTYTVNANETFIWTETCYDYKHFQGTPEVRQVNGIINKAPQNGLSNEWSTFLSFNHYHTSQSSNWKATNYGDILPVLHNRCHMDSQTLGYADRFNFIRKQFSYDQYPIMLSEASPGYTYLQGVVGTNAPKDFFTSCQIYTPPYKIKSIEFLAKNILDVPTNSTSNFDQVVITLDGRLQHAYNAVHATSDNVTNLVMLHVNTDYGNVDVRAAALALREANISKETYRTDENGVFEYLLHICQDLNWNCRRGIVGDQAPDGDLYGQADDPFGCCYPRFYFIRNVRKVFEDIDPELLNEVDFHEHPNTKKISPRDTPMVAYDFRIMEYYLRAMCGGYLNLAASRKSKDCVTVSGYENSSYADYTFEDLCYQGMKPLLAPIDCSSADGSTCLVTGTNLKNRFAVSAILANYTVTYSRYTVIHANLVAKKPPLRLEVNQMVVARTSGSTLAAYFDEAAWQSVDGISFKPAEDDDETVDLKVDHAIDGDFIPKSKFRVLFTDGTYEEQFNVSAKHTVFFPFLAKDQEPYPPHQYQFEYLAITKDNQGVFSEAVKWEKLGVKINGVIEATAPTSFSSPCKGFCAEHIDDCLKLDDSCNPYFTGAVTSNDSCASCYKEVGPPPSDFGTRYRVAYSNANEPLSDVAADLPAGDVVLTWPTENFMSYDLYVKRHFKKTVDTVDKNSDTAWELFDTNVKSPYHVYSEKLNTAVTRDVTDLVEFTGSSEVENVAVNPVNLYLPIITITMDSTTYIDVLDTKYFKIQELTVSWPDTMIQSNSGSFIKGSLVFYGKGIRTAPDVTLTYTGDKLTGITVNDGGYFYYQSGYTCDYDIRMSENGAQPYVEVRFTNKAGFDNLKPKLQFNVNRRVWVLPHGDGNTAATTEETIGDFVTSDTHDATFYDDFDKPVGAYRFQWYVSKPSAVVIHWHAANPDSLPADVEPVYNAYMLDTSLGSSAKLNVNALSLATDNPYTYAYTPAHISDSFKFYVQAEWDTFTAADTPVTYRIQPKSPRKNRWFSPLPMTIRPDIPKGFGMLPYTCAYAEMFNHYSNCINLLTKCRVDIPATLQTKKSTIYTFNVPSVRVVDNNAAGMIANVTTLFNPSPIQALGYQTKFPIVETADWETWTSVSAKYELITSNHYGQVATGLSYVHADGQGNQILNQNNTPIPSIVSRRDVMKFRMLPSQAFAAIPDSLKALVAQNKILLIIKETNSYQIFNLFGAATKGADPSTPTTTTNKRQVFTMQAMQDTSINHNLVPLMLTSEPSNLYLILTDTRWATTTCAAQYRAEYCAPIINTGQAIPYLSAAIYGSVGLYNVGAVGYLELFIDGFMPYIDVPLVP